jgi:hypothetical protein
MIHKALIRVIASIALSLTALACTGPTGPAGPAGASATSADGGPGGTGEMGAMGATGATGPAGPAGGMGTVGDAGVSIPVGCLSPCHGFSGVVSQFQSSVHYTVYLTNVNSTESQEWTAPGSACGNCHAIDALAQRIGGMVGTVAGGVVTNLASGELEYRNPDSGATTESTYTGSALVAEVYCTTCHAVTNANDPHKTGLPWTNGSFPLVVPEGATSQSFIEKSPTVNATTGTAVPGLIDGGSQGAGNTCVFCHKSRKDVTAYITASNKITNTFWGPHEGPQADVFSGLGGYAYANKTYGESTHQLKLQCVDCHMPNVANNANVPDHSFAPRLSACLGCHATATSFDVNGGQSLVRASMTELRTLLNNFGALTRSTAAPYLPIQASDMTDPKSDLSLDTSRPNGAADGGATIMTADQAGALYNYIIVARGGAMGVHNTKYTQQIVYDSIVAMGGTPIAVAIRPQ